MAIDFPQRVLFEDDLPLQAADLDEEYLYHLQRRWQHNLALHSWGIMCGLELVCSVHKPQQPLLEVRPGMALDGFGREIVLTVQRNALNELLLDPSQSYDVWIRYHVSRSESDVEPVKCMTQDFALARWQEEPQVVVLPTSDRQSTEVTKPKEVRVADLSFAPYQPMKFDSVMTWPVFLGRIERQRELWIIDNSERHYGGLKAQRIDNPYLGATQGVKRSNDSTADVNTSILNGPQSTEPELRFAVELPVDVMDSRAKSTNTEADATTHAADASGSQSDTVSSETKRFRPISIVHVPASSRDKDSDKSEAGHEITIASQRLVARQDVTLADGARIVFGAAAALDKADPTIEKAAIHRELRIGQKNVAFQDVLQFEMPSGTNSCISFGTVDASGTYKTVMKVEKDSVSVYGTLRVQGKIAGITGDAEINPSEFIQKSLEELRLLLDEATPQVRTDLIQTALAAGESAELSDAFRALTDQVRTDLIQTALAEGKSGELSNAFRALTDQQKVVAAAILSVLLEDAHGNKAYEAITDSLRTVSTQSDEVLAALVGATLERTTADRMANALKAFSNRIDVYRLIDGDLVDKLCSTDADRKSLAKSVLDTSELNKWIGDLLSQDTTGKVLKAAIANTTKEQKKNALELLFNADASLVEVATKENDWVIIILENPANRLSEVINTEDVDLSNFVNKLDIAKARELMEKLKARIGEDGGGGEADGGGGGGGGGGPEGGQN